MDERYLEHYIAALAALGSQAARDDVDRALFYWLGVDSTFAIKPESLKVKQQLEREVEARAAACFPDFQEVEAHALVWVKNQKISDFSVQVDIRSPDHPELSPEALETRLEGTFAGEGRTSVTRWKGSYGNSSGLGDMRIKSYPSGLLSGYARYVKALRDPRDIRFVNFLLQSGLAKKWGSEWFLTKALRD